MSSTYSDFKYLPTSGELPGNSFEQQTVAFLNEVGDLSYTAVETSEEALTVATAAQTSADNAQSAADAAQSTADEALATAKSSQETADSATVLANQALEAAQAAQESADTTQTTADSKADIYHASEETTYGVGSGTLYGHVMLSDETASDYGVDSGTAATPYAVEQAMQAAATAQTAAETAQTAAETAQTAAETAQKSADTAQEIAETALEAANTAQEAANTAQSAAETAQSAAESAQETADSAVSSISDLYNEIADIRTAQPYETTEVGEDTEETTTSTAIDADELTDTGLYYVDSTQSNSNLPSDNGGYLEVYNDTESAYIVQTFTDSAGVMYTRTAVISETETEYTDDDGDTYTETETVYTWTDWQSGSTSYIFHMTFTIPVEGWTENDDGYYLDTELNYVTENTIPIVSILPDYMDIAEDCGLSSTAQTLDGVLRLYSAEIPSAEIVTDLTLMSATVLGSTSDNIASDEDVDEMLTDVFG